MMVRCTRSGMHIVAAACCAAVIPPLWSAAVSAQSPWPQAQRRPAMEPAKPLALPHDPPLVGRVLKGTAFFVDKSEHMLTGRHVVEHCARIVISKVQHR